MAEIARRTTQNNNRVMFLIHRKEVLNQAVETFKNQGVDSDLLTAGMVQTLTRRVDKLPTPNVILVDEAHHALAKSYQRILNKFPKAIVLLFTATPHRTGQAQLDQIADDIIVGQSIHELTEKGFLAPFRYFQPPNDFDSKLLKRSSTGDYTAESMQEAMSTKIFGHIVKQYKRIASGMQAVVYTYSIDSAVEIAHKFNSEGISAIEVDGTTPKEKRDLAVRKFREQEIKILVNVNLFTEGVDLPNVDCVIMARPTASLALYLQFSMRCLNPRPGKTAIIIDHANNFKAFGYPDDDRDWKQAIKSGKQKSKSLLTDPGLSIITCDYCFAVVKASEVKDGECPICGKPIKVHEAKPVSDVDLVEATKERQRLIKEIVKNNLLKKVANKSVSELHSLKELQAYAKLHGYKPGWAWFQAKRKGLIRG
ncbi:MAG: DEAD/DEAH box helicase [Lactobacillus helveticus]|uniref:DEAD/DEAH box helicase n=1 Tax=Lactobacillus helveticus TaxID=1587 RepID=UPI000358599E|nr:DEAD/DEAH box helicase [Lactobacillus helveticus]AGQ23715.1 putative helicase [Lactobacillus helveticus CNRZ32]KXN77127.1 DEAD/DEAH box helicase [Lactobacillus helveticus]MBW7999098.1 DEAD/DEAH box helicase [Lactobacillus helveticus]MBW8063017.1 DEAD/DEAH box helicase [Lactobacillus helveticus]MCT3406184.1 DEAD/DEAH box helicase [Lactobacillus helveticus]